MVHDGDVDDDDDDDGDELAGRQAATETDRQTGRRVAPVGAVWYQRLKLKHTRELHRFFMPDLTRFYIGELCKQSLSLAGCADEWCIRFPSAQMVWFFEAHYVHEMSPTLH